MAHLSDGKLVEAVCILLCQKAATHEHFMSDVVVKMAHMGYEIQVHPDCSLSVTKHREQVMSIAGDILLGRRLAVVDLKRRASTIRYIVPNLRERWKEELKPYTDNQVAACYEDFSLSEDYGNNDNKFPQWFEMLEEYPTEEEVARRRDFLDGG